MFIFYLTYILILFPPSSSDVVDGALETEAAVLKTKAELETRDFFENQDGRRYKQIAAWVGKTCRRIKLQPFMKQNLQFRGVVSGPGTYNLNIFEFSLVENEANIRIRNSNDESVIRVDDSLRKTCFAHS